MRRIPGTLSARFTRSNKTKTIKLPDGNLCRIRLSPWMQVGTNWIWVASLAVSKSNRQINDWMRKRKNKRSKKLGQEMNGRFAGRVQAFAVRQLRKWMEEHPAGDAMFFKCESVESEKQFRVWKKWFLRNESKRWEILPDDLAFYFYKL